LKVLFNTTPVAHISIFKDLAWKVSDEINLKEYVLFFQYGRDKYGQVIKKSVDLKIQSKRKSDELRLQAQSLSQQVMRY
jgi:hypothetical protein